MNTPHNSHRKGFNNAADAVRAKLQSLYANEPSARQELTEAKHNSHRSKHQEFIYNLSRSGKSLADIQIEWHNYYRRLSDAEKHQVWQEFYTTHQQTQNRPHEPTHKPRYAPKYQTSKPTKNIHEKIVKEVRRQARTPKKDHLQSLAFGLGFGSLVLLIFLFGFFNERFIAPFITPSKTVSSTPIIIDPDKTKVSKDPKVVIPKINVEIPVVYDEPSIAEDDVQKALERGTLHYPTTAEPGQKGNAVIFGHSSNNIFNSGKYKFAFVLLKEMQKGDTFMLHKDGTRYVYRVFDKKVVSPENTSVLNPIDGKKATATLITCDPPGTSINRLVVVGEQISPSPDKNTKSTAKPADTSTETLPSNAPSLWSRLWDWI